MWVNASLFNENIYYQDNGEYSAWIHQYNGV